jgi:hypothetical protein
VDLMSLHVVTYNNHVVAHLVTTPSLARMSTTGKKCLLKQLGNSRHREGPWVVAVELGLGGAKLVCQQSTTMIYTCIIVGVSLGCVTARLRP